MSETPCGPPFTASPRKRERYARNHGYFWLPCPICGREFGGNEWHRYEGKSASIPTGVCEGIGICPWCTLEGKGSDEILLPRMSDTPRQRAIHYTWIRSSVEVPNNDLFAEALALLHRCQPCGPIPLRAIVAEFLQRAAEAGYTS